jgi:hypothetical protein
MYKIKIAGAVVATDAAEWLDIQGYDWNMDISSLSVRPLYTFSFSKADQASHFALKWT